MRKLIFIEIAFNTFTFSDIRFTPKWIRYRMRIFMNYTFKSLINQSNQNFICIVRYEESTENIIKEELLKYSKLPNNIIFATKSYNIEHIIKKYDYLYKVRLDNDDMYHSSFIQQLLDYKPMDDTEVLINQHGYVYDIINDRLGKWYFQSPPFYTLIYKTQDYIEKQYRYELQGGHPGAIKLKHEIINNINYVVILHGKNTLNKFNSNNQVGIITDIYTKEEILKDFYVIKFNDMI